METGMSLLITAGNGPDECHQAVAGVLGQIQDEAECLGVAIDVDAEPAEAGLKSVVLVLQGAAAADLAARWRGTICWRGKSSLRRHHKRSNWFVGVFELRAQSPEPGRIRPQDVVFDSFRAGGPGGQHQNTTDSAVRATHTPSGLTAVSRDMRSQHRNKALAMQRLQALCDARVAAVENARAGDQRRLHQAIARGNPIRTFTGPKFREVTRR